MSEKEKLAIECGGKTFSYQGRRSERVKDVIDFIIKAPNVKGNELEVFRKNITDAEAADSKLTNDEQVQTAIEDARKAREAKKAAKAGKGGDEKKDNSTAAATGGASSSSTSQQQQQAPPQQQAHPPVETPAVVKATQDVSFEKSLNEQAAAEKEQKKKPTITTAATPPTTTPTNSKDTNMSTKEKQHINDFIQQVLQEPEADLVAALKAKPNTDVVTSSSNNNSKAAASADDQQAAAGSANSNKNKISIILAISGSETNKALIINRDVKFADLAAAAERKIGGGTLRLEFQDGDDRIDLDDDDSLEMFLDVFERAKSRHKLTCTPLTQLSRTNDDNLTSTGHQQSSGNYAKVNSPPPRLSNTAGVVLSAQAQESINANGGKMLRELKTFTGHTSAVYSCAFAPSGERFVTTSRDKSIRFWNARDNNEEPKVVKNGHNGIVLSCDASPNGKFVVTSSDDSTVKIWNMDTQEKVTSFKGHSDKVYCSQFNPSGAYVSTCSCDKSVRVWNVDTGAKMASLKGHTLPVFSCAFSNTDGGKYVVSGSDDRSIKLWDWRDSKDAVKTLLGHTGTVWSSKFSHDDRIIASTSMDHEIKLWDVRKEGQCLKTLGGHLTPIHHAVFSKNDKYLFTCARDWTIMCWDMEKFALVDTFQSHSNTVYHIAMSPSGKELLSSSLDETVKLWSVASIGSDKILA